MAVSKREYITDAPVPVTLDGESFQVRALKRKHWKQLAGWRHSYKPDGTKTRNGRNAWSHEMHMLCRKEYLTNVRATIASTARKFKVDGQKIRWVAVAEQWPELRRMYQQQWAVWAALPTTMRDPGWMQGYFMPGLKTDRFTGVWYMSVHEQYLQQAERIPLDIQKIDELLDTKTLTIEERTALVRSKCQLLEEMRHLLGIPKVKPIDRNSKQLKRIRPTYELPPENAKGLQVVPADESVHGAIDTTSDTVLSGSEPVDADEAEQRTP